MRQHDNDEQEAASIIAWTERRLEHSGSSSMVQYCTKQFKKMWIESFGSIDSVPQDFKNKVEKLYHDLKCKEIH